jgi:hypothetical protein
VGACLKGKPSGDYISGCLSYMPVLDPHLEAVRRKCSDVTLASKQVFDETLRAALEEWLTSNWA